MGGDPPRVSQAPTGLLRDGGLADGERGRRLTATGPGMSRPATGNCPLSDTSEQNEFSQQKQLRVMGYMALDEPVDAENVARPRGVRIAR